MANPVRKALLILLVASPLWAAGQPRREMQLSYWDFSSDSIIWRQVRVPHDWAIAGPFDKKWDLQKVAIEQNGETQATEKSGRSGALPWIGRGWYRTSVAVPAGYDAATIVFDGAMAEPSVTVNGRYAGGWVYGYNAFRIDATPFLKDGRLDIGVALNNVEESSRWYPGAGLYRPVKIVFHQKASLDDWGTYVRTEKLTGEKAVVRVSTACKLPSATSATGFATEVTLYDNDGRLVGATHQTLTHGEAEGTIEVSRPKAWTPETPYLYNMVVRLYDNGRLIDEQWQKVGLRTVSVSRQGGFLLNGITRKLKGVCLHHDLGPLGAAVNKAAIIRQIKTMKAMGCDAIRTAHNMPSQMQMDVCDSLGMMVMAESFDMWIYPKCKNGYARYFKEWADRDITNLVLNHRNHPSIVMWSIGNEIPEQWSDEGREIARHLQDLCHSLDNTRPVTQGMDRAEDALKSGFAQVMDVPGFNYRVHKYKKNIEQLPQGFLLGSETASTVSSRGIYKFPVVPDNNSRFASYSPDYDPKAINKADGQCSSYDVEYCPWSNLPDDDWTWQDDYPWVTGEFVWTGYDYLGEPSPYDEYWPSRSSYFGICDLAGLPKDRYWLYRSKWNRGEHTIHLLPHWSWGMSKKDKGNRLGKVTPVYCYTDYPSAELFVNGKSQGRRSKNKESRLDRYRLRWNDVKYEPGELRVVVYDNDGRPCGEQTVKTAGSPAHLLLSPWTANGQGTLRADGDDMAFVTVSLTDSEGTLVPSATDQLTFEVSGAGEFEAVCNGDATSLESLRQPTMRLFGGQLVVVVRSTASPGIIRLKVNDRQRGLEEVLEIEAEQ